MLEGIYSCYYCLFSNLPLAQYMLHRHIYVTILICASCLLWSKIIYPSFSLQLEHVSILFESQCIYVHKLRMHAYI